MSVYPGYLDAYIEKCPAFGWQGGPAFSTTIVTMSNGREMRNAEWSSARHSFSLPFKNIRREAYAQIKQMHLLCRGRLSAFKFIDHLDYQASDETFAIGDGLTTTFQLRKYSMLDGVTYVRDTNVVRGNVAIRVNGVSVASTLDRERGLVTLASAPADGSVLAGDWEFGIWVRFNQDDLPFSIDAGNGRGDKFIGGQVDLIEVAPPPVTP